MNHSSVAAAVADSAWVRFWHDPVRAERLAAVRIILAAALLVDLLIQYLPNLSEFYGPEGIAPSGLYEASQLQQWRITHYFFNTDNLAFIYPMFGAWVTVTALFLVGWQTRCMNVLCWLLTRCFLERSPNVGYSGDDVLQAALFLLMLTPCGEALSLDARRLRRGGLLVGPALVPPWSLRLMQIQLCVIYCSSGAAKLFWDFDRQWDAYSGTWNPWLSQSTWWTGESIHYFLNDSNRARRSFAEYPVPFWMTMIATYATVWWELLFPALMLTRWTRIAALAFGVLFHIGIMLSVDITWFGFYSLAFYCLWIPDCFWARFDAKTGVPS